MIADPPPAAAAWLRRCRCSRRAAAPPRGRSRAPGSRTSGAGYTGAACTPAPRDAYVYIGWPQDGRRLLAPALKVWFGTRNFGVAPAGVTKVNTGHHHLIIDAPLPPPAQPIPNDRNHLHFGLGQTETDAGAAAGYAYAAAGDGRCASMCSTTRRWCRSSITIHVRAARAPAVAAATPQ